MFKKVRTPERRTEIRKFLRQYPELLALVVFSREHLQKPYGQGSSGTTWDTPGHGSFPSVSFAKHSFGAGRAAGYMGIELDRAYDRMNPLFMSWIDLSLLKMICLRFQGVQVG
mmetsp:Transcript_4435/g.18922  ORF Transcript_4435/g.18922 Transcript_4435/m.18922 type:complete len:113 (+) Transcript_4435:410-748(+)